MDPEALAAAADGPVAAFLDPDGSWSVLGGPFRPVRRPEAGTPHLFLEPFPGATTDGLPRGLAIPAWAAWGGPAGGGTVGTAPRPSGPTAGAPTTGTFEAAPRDAWPEWEERILIARTFALEGRVTKVVLARSLQADVLRPGSPAGLATRLRQAHPHATIALLQAADGAIVAATPETLLDVRGGIARAVALAGTREPGQPWRAKELAEHLPVVTQARAALEKACTGVTHRGPATVNAGPVDHLATVVEGRLQEGAEPHALAALLHPSPATAGHPVEPSLELIRRLEPAPRGLYAAAAGVLLPDGSFRAHVLLRAAELRNGTATVRAGAGITRDSDPREEWTETALKASTVVDVLQEANRAR